METERNEPGSGVLDELIIANRKLEAIQVIRDSYNCRIDEALEILVAKYRMLRSQRPEAFFCGDAEYWRGFSS